MHDSPGQGEEFGHILIGGEDPAFMPSRHNDDDDTCKYSVIINPNVPDAVDDDNDGI